MRFVPLIIAFVVWTALAFEIWYRGYRHGYREATDEMRVHLDTALKMRQVTFSVDEAHNPDLAELLRILRAKVEHPAGEGEQ